MILRQIFVMTRKSGTAIILIMFFALQGFVFAPFCSSETIIFGGEESPIPPVVTSQISEEEMEAWSKAEKVARIPIFQGATCRSFTDEDIEDAIKKRILPMNLDKATKRRIEKKLNIKLPQRCLKKSER